MTPQSYGLILIVGSALLAFWILWRYAGFGPKSILWAAVHAVLACAVLRSVPYALDRIGTSGPETIEYVEIFGIALNWCTSEGPNGRRAYGSNCSSQRSA